MACGWMSGFRCASSQLHCPLLKLISLGLGGDESNGEQQDRLPIKDLQADLYLPQVGCCLSRVDSMAHSQFEQLWVILAQIQLCHLPRQSACHAVLGLVPVQNILRMPAQSQHPMRALENRALIPEASYVLEPFSLNVSCSTENALHLALDMTGNTALSRKWSSKDFAGKENMCHEQAGGLEQSHCMWSNSCTRGLGLAWICALQTAGTRATG